jgi:drug/metabolite transporter (DMT)-like permease
LSTGTSHRPISTRRAAPRPLWIAYGALALAVGGIAWSAVLIRWAGIPGPASAFHRVLIAAIVLVPWRLVRGTRRRITNRAAWLALAGGAFFGLDLALYNTAVMRTSAATASFLGNSAPIFVGLGAWLVFHRRPPGAFWTGLGLAAIGGGIMVASHLRGTEGIGDPLGDLLAVIAAVFFAGYLLIAERLRSTMDTLTFNTVAILGSVLILLVLCLIIGAPLAGYSRSTWAALGGLGLVSQLGAYYALVYALGHLPATITSVGLLTQLPLTALLAALLLHEPITRAQVVGGALVLVGVYVVNRRLEASKDPRA